MAMTLIRDFSDKTLTEDLGSPFAGVARRAKLLLRFDEAERATAENKALQIYETEPGYTYHEALATVVQHEQVM